MIRLSTELDIYYKSKDKNKFVRQVSSTVITPFKAFPLLLIFASHIFNPEYNEKLIIEAIKKNFIIIYFCDKIPDDAIIHESIIYIKAKWRYFDTSIFKDINQFSAVHGVNKKGEKLALQYARVFSKKYIRNSNELSEIVKHHQDIQENVTILFDTIFECGDRGLGDILLTTPIVTELKKKFNASITYACRPKAAELLQNNPDIDKVITKYSDLEKLQFTYHLPLIRHTENYKVSRNRQCRTDSLADLFMVTLPKDNVLPKIYLTPKEIQNANRLVNKVHKIKLGINIEATSSARRWTYGYLLELFKLLGEEDSKYEFYLFGSGDRMKITGIPKYIHNFIGKLTLRDSIAVMSKMDMALTTDSLYSHVAGAFKIPQVCIYTTIPAEWRNKYYKSIGVQGTTKCSPCCDFQFLTKEDYDKCDRFGVPPCVKSITPDTIMKNLEICKRRYNVDTYSTKETILINRSSGLGDILMLTSVLHDLRLKEKDAFITLRTNCPDLFIGNSDVDEILTGTYIPDKDLQTRFYDYDRIYNFDYCLESYGVAGKLGKISDKDYMTVSRIDLLYNWAKMKCPKNPKLYYFVTESEKRRVEKMLKTLWGKKTVTYVLNCTSPYRTYPIKESLKVIEELSKTHNVFIIGNSITMWGEDHEFNKVYYEVLNRLNGRYVVDLVDKTELRLACAIIEHSDLVITPDTGMLHVANAVDTTCLALFGNIDPYLRVKYYKNTSTIYKNISCAEGCGDRGNFMRSGKIICPDFYRVKEPEKRIGAICMRAITSEEIIQKSKELLQNGGTL